MAQKLMLHSFGEVIQFSNFGFISNKFNLLFDYFCIIQYQYKLNYIFLCNHIDDQILK